MTKINKGDIVKHEAFDAEMKVLLVNGMWATCEFADKDGFRVEKVVDQSLLTVVKRAATMLDAM